MARWANEHTWDAAIQAASVRFGVPVALIKAIIGQESAFRPTAYRAEPAISDASIGLMQILFSTAKGEGYTGSVGSATGLTGLYDPATNIMFGTSYLATCLARANGIFPSAISIYNGGFRPDIGFGAPATKRILVCLRRDSLGKCIESRTVEIGQYANQPYVNAVLNNIAYFESEAKVSMPTVVGGVSPPLDDAPIANHVESQDGGRASGHVAGPLGTHNIITPPQPSVMRWCASIVGRIVSLFRFFFARG
jgi:transglycosylase-like protein with SLT domain